MSVPEGQIGISYKGDYNSNTAYERLDAVFHNGSTYLAIKDAPDGAPRDDKTNWIYLAKGYDGETVDVADSEIAFTDSETRENIASGEKVSTVFGKVKKFFTDLTAPAFAQMITTKEDLLATKVTGYVPDAKAVADGFADVNGKLIEIEKISFAIDKSVTTQNSKVAIMYTATQRCIVIISAVQQMANVSPKETIIYHSNHNSFIRNVGSTTATLCCHLEVGESVELYASANTAGTNYFTARGIAIKI